MKNIIDSSSDVQKKKSKKTINQNKNSIFKKPAVNIIQAFEVSCDSTSVDIQDISDLDSTNTNLINPFKAPKKVTQQTFDVSLNESVNDSESEQTITTTKTLFKKKINENVNDLFHVSYNETNGEITYNDSCSTSSAEKGADNFMKSNPFKKKKKSSIGEPEFNVSLIEKNKKNSVTEEAAENGNIDKSDTNVFESSDLNLDSDADTNSFIIKPNPFKFSLKSKKDSLNVNNFSSVENNLKSSRNKKSLIENSRMEVSSEKDGERTLRDEMTESNIENLSDGSLDENITLNKDDGKDTTKVIAKSNPFKKSIKSKNDSIHQAIHVTFMEEEEEPEKSFSFIKSIDGNKSNPFKKNSKFSNNSSLGEQLQVSFQEEDSEKSLTTKTINRDNVEESEKNIPFSNNSIHEKVSGVEMHLDQSSFNDDNLNNWTYDYVDKDSDEEMNLPSVPPVLTNTSVTMKKLRETSALESKENISMSWEDKFKKIISQNKKVNEPTTTKKAKESQPVKVVAKTKPVMESNVYRPPKLIKPAKFASRNLYQHIIRKMEPKFGIDTYIKAEELVLSICNTVKIVTRRKAHQKKLIQDLKKEMALAGVIETTVDFYEFIIKFLPYSFRVKVVPCLQPVTNAIVPPKDVVDPFDKILK